VAVAAIKDFLNRLGIAGSDEGVRSIALLDGVHVGKSWLGQPRFLPHIEGATGAVEIAAVSRSSIPPRIAYSDGDLVANAPFDDEFIITDRIAGWSRRVSFTSTAEVHTWNDCANDALPLVAEWESASKTAPLSIRSQHLEWDEQAYVLQDMIEALYASSRSGIGEGDAIGLIDRATDSRSWELLRTLQEATFFNAHLRPRWRGHVLTLARPMLTEVRTSDATFVIASGAIPARLETEFRRTVELNGGRPFRRLLQRSLAPPLLGALNIDAKTLAKSLGWVETTHPSPMAGGALMRLSESNVVGEHYPTASSWDWSAGSFRRGPPAKASSTLVRIVHPAGRDHDLYRVFGDKQRTYTSRYAAIVALYSQARAPLFRWRHDKLIRLTHAGSLPLELAQAVRLRELFNGGAGLDGWEYSTSAETLQWLQRFLRELIVGEIPAKHVDENKMHLRGQGARRAMWVDGSIAG
jgi:hypothetical protein